MPFWGKKGGFDHCETYHGLKQISRNIIDTFTRYLNEQIYLLSPICPNLGELLHFMEFVRDRARPVDAFSLIFFSPISGLEVLQGYVIVSTCQRMRYAGTAFVINLFGRTYFCVSVYTQQIARCRWEKRATLKRKNDNIPLRPSFCLFMTAGMTHSRKAARILVSSDVNRAICFVFFPVYF